MFARILSLLAPFALIFCSAVSAMAANVTTYHNDNLRSGWNPAETMLTRKTASSLVLQQQVPLDAQVDAEPLLMTGVSIAGGVHDVVYVVTENDTVYAIDAQSGAVLLTQSLGTPVPLSNLPGGCNNGDVTLGIGNTPVIDPAAGTLYVMSYTFENSSAVFRLHALDIATLADKVPAAVVSATSNLVGGGTADFDSNAQRARAALLLSNGVIYAGFASYCDYEAYKARGWLLGWKANTLAPLPHPGLLDRQGFNPDYFFLSTIWMSGFGIATDDRNGLFFATGNTDVGNYNHSWNLAESVVNLSTNLHTVQGYYTPSGADWGELALDKTDGDLGAGGVMLLPPQQGDVPNLAVIAAKKGPLLLLNRDNLGGQGKAGREAIVGQYSNDGGCWCGPSSFNGPDGAARIVESTGSTLRVWKLRTSPTTRLVQQSTTSITSGQDPGFFTSVSSNGIMPGSAVIWALGRPVNSDPGNMMLYAVDPDTAQILFSAVAGTWPNASQTNANLVPLVANGHVYVASYRSLAIFGPDTNGFAISYHAPASPAFVQAASPHEVWGRITSIDGNTATIVTRDAKTISIDETPAQRASRKVGLGVGDAADFRGDYRNGIFMATAVIHAKPSPALWRPDR